MNPRPATRRILARSILAAALLLAAATAAAGAPDREEKQRSWFTNTTLVDQRGEEVRFFEDVVKDHVVVIQFIFTRCGDACPLLTQKLLQTRAALGGDLGERVRFVSISVDPSHDGPAQLRAFAEKQGSAVPGWVYLAGKKEHVDLVVKRLGQYVDAPENHATVFIAGNARTGHWLRIRPDSPAAAIAAQVESLRSEDVEPGKVRSAAAVRP
jgi:cytochrome oxidase Cu insertion factor (SCO1/SenC/PrrC family)